MLTKADKINTLNRTFEQAKRIAIEEALRANTTIHEQTINRLISENKSVEMALEEVNSKMFEVETLNAQLKGRQNAMKNSTRTGRKLFLCRVATT